MASSNESYPQETFCEHGAFKRNCYACIYGKLQSDLRKIVEDMLKDEEIMKDEKGLSPDTIIRVQRKRVEKLLEGE